MDQKTYNRRRALLARHKINNPTTSPEGKRMHLTADMVPAKEWTGISTLDAVARGQRAEAAMMKRMEKVCWHCSKAYSPQLFDSSLTNRLFCSTTCSNHAFTVEQQHDLMTNYPREWAELSTNGAFD